MSKTGCIVAMGGGRFDDGEVFPIVEYIINHSRSKTPGVLYLPTAGHDDISDIKPIQDAFERFGGKFTYLLLTDTSLSKSKIKDTILSADVIFVGGGNLQFLMDTFKSTAADKYLIEAYNNGAVLSGVSSGAMCWFDKGFDDCGENHCFVFVDCMGILPFCNCPHFESGNWQNFKNEVRFSGKDGIACENGAALTYSDEKYSVIHGNDGGEVFYFKKSEDFRMTQLSPDAKILNC